MPSVNFQRTWVLYNALYLNWCTDRLSLETLTSAPREAHMSHPSGRIPWDHNKIVKYMTALTVLLLIDFSRTDRSSVRWQVSPPSRRCIDLTRARIPTLTFLIHDESGCEVSNAGRSADLAENEVRHTSIARRNKVTVRTASSCSALPPTSPLRSRPRLASNYEPTSHAGTS